MNSAASAHFAETNLSFKIFDLHVGKSLLRMEETLPQTKWERSTSFLWTSGQQEVPVRLYDVLYLKGMPAKLISVPAMSKNRHYGILGRAEDEGGSCLVLHGRNSLSQYLERKRFLASRRDPKTPKHRIRLLDNLESS